MFGSFSCSGSTFRKRGLAASPLIVAPLILPSYFSLVPILTFNYQAIQKCSLPGNVLFSALRAGVASMWLLHTVTHSVTFDNTSARHIRACTSCRYTQAQPLLQAKMLDAGSHNLRHLAIPQTALTLHGIASDGEQAFQPDFTNG